MGFREGNYATVWEVKPGKGNYSDVRISTSKKNKQNDQYETDFSGFVRFIGDAAKVVQNMKPKDRIKIGACEVTNTYVKEKNTTYTNFAVFTCENANNNNAQPNPTIKKDADGFIELPGGIDEELPFI